MKQYTDITLLVDRSGSMASIKGAMEEAYLTFLKEHKANPSTRITLIQFDGTNKHAVQYQNVPISAAEPLNLRPRGDTPLLDAFVTAIDATGQRLSDLDESDRPDQVLFVVITDGQENSSKIYKRQDVANRVTKQHATYKWQFLYLGANQDSFGEAASMGIQHDWSFNYKPTTSGVGGMAAAFAANSVSYTTNSSAMRGKAIDSFTKGQRLKAADGDESLINPTTTTSSVGDANTTP